MISWAYKTVARLSVCLLAALWLTACGSTPPYVYNEAEFDRTNPNFAKPPADISKVSVCYAKRSATPAAIADLAAKECAKYGKISRFRETSLAVCPAVTPLAAVFDCLHPGDGSLRADRGRRRAASGKETAREAPSSPEGARPLGLLFGRPDGENRN